MEILLKNLSKHPAVDALINNKASFANLSIQQEALLIASSYIKKPRGMVIIKPNLFLAQQLMDALAAYLDNPETLFLFSQEDSLRVEEIAKSSQMQSEKIASLIKALTIQHPICITHVGAVLRKYPNKQTFLDNILRFKINQQVDIQQVLQQLIMMGYTCTSFVDQPLTFSYRGSILDIYDLANDQPIRIEFFDNEIESIRHFDMLTQRTVKVVSEATIYFANDFILTKRQKEFLIETLKAKADLPSTHPTLQTKLNHDVYLLENDSHDSHLYRYSSLLDDLSSFFDLIAASQIIISPIEQVEQSAQKIMEDNFEYINELQQNHMALASYEVFFDIHKVLTNKKALPFNLFQTQNQIEIPWHPVDLAMGSIPLKIKTAIKQNKIETLVIAVSKNHAKMVMDSLIDAQIPYKLVHDKLVSGINVLMKEYPFGFVDATNSMMVISESDLLEVKTKTGRFINRFKEAEALTSYQQLAIGDYVVHQQHGIGSYQGITTQQHHGIHKDYLHIVYKDEAVLYVPLEQFQLVRKFVSSEGAKPRLNKLGSNEWSKTKQKISESVEELAEQLIELYQLREQQIGHQFKPDSEDQVLFEEQFDYELTNDQKIAIKEIKQDMESKRPMDRLLCGDVGFGKTEVAMRAAFKAVSENKQVVFLCPTTVLSFQHNQTFSKRFENFAVNIALLNRFIPLSKQKEILKQLKAGQIDILIGTHRVLSEDIKFSDLGLLIIDEEQRFGVEHKEKIKQLKASVDVLSLSATPIPRTLQMSLVGIRSLSQLNTPPLNRIPIQTYVVNKNRVLIKEIIERELSRNGQVFYLFNNIERIYEVATQIQRDVPKASVAVAHGKMDKDEIEEVMIRFNNNEYQVLVCTTIIETGIDIPNANTMIVDHADRFGLSQLYQIRGRVGRSDRLAYTYLLIQPQKQLTEVATKRLQAIKEFTELGSGYKIAMRDLTIRGAGQLLGDKQSGFIDTVGMDMYIELLKQAIAKKQNQPIEEIVGSTALQIGVDAYIPKAFTDQDLSKIELYQKINTIKKLSSLNEYMDEIVDQYGKLPHSVAMLFEKKRLELLLLDQRVDSFKERKQEVILTFTQAYSNQLDGVALFKLVNDISSDIALKYTNNKISLTFKKSDVWLSQINQLLLLTSPKETS